MIPNVDDERIQYLHRFSSISKAFASELLRNFAEMFIGNTHIFIYFSHVQIFKHTMGC